MANDISSTVSTRARALACKVFRPDSKAAAGVTALINEHEKKGDGRNIAAYAQLFQELLDKGIQGYSVIRLGYRAPVHSHDGKHAGKCSLCSATLKHGHILSVRGTKHDKITNKARREYEILVGNDHLDHLQQLTSAIDDKDFSTYLRNVCEIKGHASGNKRSLEDLANALGVEEDSLRTLRYVQKFVDIYNADASAIAAVQSAGIEKTGRAWLEQEIKKGRMPFDVEEAYERFEGGWYTREHAVTLDKAIKEGMLLPSGGLIPDIKADARYIFQGDCLADEALLEKLREACGQEFKPRPLIEMALGFERKEGQTVAQKADDSFMTYSDALALRRQLAGLSAVREQHNTILAKRYCADDFAERFDVAKTLVQTQKKALADYHAKKPKRGKAGANVDDYERVEDERAPRIMLTQEYRTIRDALQLLEDAQSANPRADLIRLLPMPLAQKVFRSVYLVSEKDRCGKDQKLDLAPVFEIGEGAGVDMDRILHTPMASDTKSALSDEKYACTRAGLTVSNYSSKKAKLEDGTLVPAKLAEKMFKGSKSDLMRMHEAVKDAKQLDADSARTIDWLVGLAESPLAFTCDGLNAKGIHRNRSEPRFNPSQYKGARYLFHGQKMALADVAKQVAKEKLDQIDLGMLAEGAMLLAKETRPVYNVTNTFIGGMVSLSRYEDKKPERGSYMRPFLYKQGLVQAASAPLVEQDARVWSDLLKIQHNYRDDLETLASGKAIASRDAINHARKVVADVREGKSTCSPYLALKELIGDDGRSIDYLHGQYKSFDVHVESGAEDARTAKDEMIRTCAKPSGDKERKRGGEQIGRMQFNGTLMRFEKRNVSKEELYQTCQDLATNNFLKGRHVYVVVDAAR